MAKAKTKAAGIAVEVPQSDAEAERMIARLGALMLDYEAAKARHTEVVAEHGRKVATLNEAFSVTETEYQQASKAIKDGLNVFATANRARLTSGGRTKTIQFATGKVFWKEGATSIGWGKLKNAEVVARVEARLVELSKAIAAENKRSLKDALRRDAGIIATFLQTKVSPSKAAMGDHPALAEAIPGITVNRPGEEFDVEPLASQIREVA